jgi:hypothetical protein
VATLIHGAMIRPGAPFAPAVVWQALQLPTVWADIIARTPPEASVTFAVNGTAIVLPA